MESTRGIRTLVVLLELLEEMVAWGCRNGKFNEQFQILPLELKLKFISMLSYVFQTVIDVPARFISATLHVDKSLKMAVKLGDCRKLSPRSYKFLVKVGPQSFFLWLPFLWHLLPSYVSSIS